MTLEPEGLPAELVFAQAFGWVQPVMVFDEKLIP
jgi:hypothetical protein